MFYNGINLHNIIRDCNTFEMWSASERAYELFGANLDLEQTKVNVGDFQWAEVVYNSKFHTELFLIINVDWDEADWIKVKSLKSKAIQVGKNNSLKNQLSFPDESVVRKEEQTIFLRALSTTNGMLTKASKVSKIPLSKYRQWISSDTLFKEAVSEISNSVLDDVESALINEATEGNTHAIKYFLDARATDRGYGEKGSAIVEEQQSLDLSLLSLEEQKHLSKLLEKAQPKII